MKSYETEVFVIALRFTKQASTALVVRTSTKWRVIIFMNFTLRLYRRHDMDLITLYKDNRVAFSILIKAALKAYICNEPFLFYPPEPSDIEYSKFDFKSHYRTVIHFDDNMDKEIIDWLNSTKPAYKTAAIKTVIRASIAVPITYACMANDEEKQRFFSVLSKTKDFYPNMYDCIFRKKYQKKEKKKLNIQTEKTVVPKKISNPVKTDDKNTVTPAKPIEHEKASIVPHDEGSIEEFDMFADVNSMLNSF